MIYIIRVIQAEEIIIKMEKLELFIINNIIIVGSIKNEKEKSYYFRLIYNLNLKLHHRILLNPRYKDKLNLSV